MPEKNSQIIGMEKEILAVDFDVPVHFHALSMFSVNFYDNSSSATFGGYASRAAFEAGKRPLIHTTAQINAVPTGDVSELTTWFVERLLAAATSHDFTGARAVYAEVAPAAIEEPEA